MTRAYVSMLEGRRQRRRQERIRLGAVAIRGLGGVWFLMWPVLIVIFVVCGLAPDIGLRWPLQDLFELLAWAHLLLFPIVGCAVIGAAASRVVLDRRPPARPSFGEAYLTLCAGALMLGALLAVLVTVHTPPSWGLGPAYPDWLLPAAPLWSPLVFLLAAAGSAWGTRAATELGIDGSRRGLRLVLMLAGWLFVVGLFSLVQVVNLPVLHPGLWPLHHGGSGWRTKPEAMRNAILLSTLVLPALLVELDLLVTIRKRDDRLARTTR